MRYVALAGMHFRILRYEAASIALDMWLAKTYHARRASGWRRPPGHGSKARLGRSVAAATRARPDDKINLL
jgi:hypothetical protein